MKILSLLLPLFHPPPFSPPFPLPLSLLPSLPPLLFSPSSSLFFLLPSPLLPLFLPLLPSTSPVSPPPPLYLSLSTSCLSPSFLPPSWHLWCALSALGYHHLTSASFGALHCSYAAQLEALGLWQWAVLVLLHLRDGGQRERAVGGVLERQASPDEDLSEAEGFVIERLQVPEKWVFRAKVGTICCKHHLPCNKNTSTHTLSICTISIVTTSHGHLLLSPFHC